MSACIVAGQLVMLPMAVVVGTKADAWGRKPILLAALAILRCAGCSTRTRPPTYAPPK
jgi:hypothetical protein